MSTASVGKKSALKTLKQIGADEPGHALYQTYSELAAWVKQQDDELKKMSLEDTTDMVVHGEEV